MKLRSLRALVYAQLFCLVLQFFVGVAFAIYVITPFMMDQSLLGQPLSMLIYSFAVFGVAVLLIGGYLAVERGRFKLESVMRSSLSLGFLFALLANLGGVGFIFTDGANEPALFMAMCFVFAILCYAITSAFLLASG